jgi:hypothetical protein
VTDTTPPGTAASEEPTQQLRVTGTRLPGPLDPARPSGGDATGTHHRSGTQSRPGTQGSSGTESKPRTEVLSIHDLMDGPPGAPQVATGPAVATAPAAPAAEPLPTPAASPAPRPAAAPAPVPAVPAPARERSEVAERLRADAAAAWDGARRRTADWLRQGDNALIVATAVVALLLVIVLAGTG